MFYKLLIWWDKYRIKQWIRELSVEPSFQGRRLITVKEIVRKFSNVTSVELADTLTQLVEEGFFERFYRVVRLDGTSVDWLFTDPRDIPDRIYDPVLMGFRDSGPMEIEVVFITNV